jgi:hypothetical protein
MTKKKTYLLNFFVSLAFLFGGLPSAAFVSRNAADGGRGGAIGTAIALLFLFTNRNYGIKIYTALTHELPDLQARINGIRRMPALLRRLRAYQVTRESQSLKRVWRSLSGNLRIWAGGRSAMVVPTATIMNMRACLIRLS